MIKTAIAGGLLFGGVAQFFYLIILLIFWVIETQECYDTGNWARLKYRDFKAMYNGREGRFSVRQFSVKDRSRNLYYTFSFMDGLRIYGMFSRLRKQKKRRNRRNFPRNRRNF